VRSACAVINTDFFWAQRGQRACATDSACVGRAQPCPDCDFYRRNMASKRVLSKLHLQGGTNVCGHMAARLFPFLSV
jgi:hypothetical protein